MNEQRVLKILNEVGAVITNSHIVYTSGKHGSAYVNKDALYPHTEATSDLCWSLAERFKDDGVEVVVAPAIGGVILSQWVTHHLVEMTNDIVLGVYAEKEPILISEPGEVVGTPIGEKFVIKRSYDKLVTGKRVLVVEDVLTTGGSVKKVVEAVRAIGGEVVGVGVLCNRGGITIEDLAEVPRLEALVNITLEAWDGAECPLCARGVPINTDVGKGREFLARKQKTNP